MEKKEHRKIGYWRIMYIDSSLLEVPRESYQKPLNEKRVAQIVAEFDENIANEPKVSYSIRILSLNHPSPLLGPSTFEEDVSGNLADVEQAALKNIRKQLLFDAIKTLSPLQQELLWEVFLSPKPISLTEYAVKNNILCSSACERKRRAFATIKKFLEKHGITSEEFD